MRRPSESWEFAAHGVIAGACAAALLLVGAPIAFAGSPAVSIVELDERYHFQPGSVTVAVGQTVTWTNNSDAPHTVSSDAGGTLDSGIVDENGTYQHTFNAAGDFAYHCDVHDYMHGTVHVAALDPTDAAGVATGVDSTGSGPLAVATVAGIGSILVIGALGLRLRRRENRD